MLCTWFSVSPATGAPCGVAAIVPTRVVVAVTGVVVATAGVVVAMMGVVVDAAGAGDPEDEPPPAAGAYVPVVTDDVLLCASHPTALSVVGLHNVRLESGRPARVGVVPTVVK